MRITPPETLEVIAAVRHLVELQTKIMSNIGESDFKDGYILGLQSVLVFVETIAQVPALPSELTPDAGQPPSDELNLRANLCAPVTP